MRTDHPLNLLDLPYEILTSIFELCVEGIEALVEQPPKRRISRRREVLSRTHPVLDGGHRYRFVFKDVMGNEVSLGLLAVSRQMREEAIRIVAASISLVLSISSYAPSITTPPQNIILPGWADAVKELTVPRFLGSLASMSELLSNFKSLRGVNVVWGHAYQLRSNHWMRFYSSRWDMLREQVEEPGFRAFLRSELALTFRKLQRSCCAVSDRGYRIRVEVRFGSFADQKDPTTASGIVSRRYTAIVS